MRVSSATVCVALLTALISFPAQPGEGYVTEVVTISSGDIKLRALLGRPEGAGPFPAYIHNHGSMTFEQAHSAPWPSSIAKGSLPDALVRDGYVVLVLYRRGHKGSEGTTSTYSENMISGGNRDRIATDIMRGAEEEAEDVIAALEYLRRLSYVDQDRVAVGGHSLGGLVSVMAASRDRRFAALITMAGGIRWERQGGFDTARPLVQGVWKDAARQLRIPVLILWSANDTSLNEIVGRELEMELRRAGKSVEMKVYPPFQQNGHFLFNRAEGYPIFAPDVVRFLDSHLQR